MRDGVNRTGWLVLLLLALSSGYFIARGPVRALDQTVDLPTFYAATRVWMMGQNPYDQPTTQRIYEEADGSEYVVAICMNPPCFFPLLAPLAAVSYPVAQWAMVLINIVSLLVAGWTFGRAAGLLDHPKLRWLWWGAILALAPVHTTISQGQHGLLVMALLGLALLADESRRDVVVGLCLAIAAALKPQMVLLFGVYYLLRGRWRVCAAGAIASILLLTLGIGRMMLAGINWWPSMLANMDAFTNATMRNEVGAGTANYAILGDGRFIMIDIEALIHYLTSESMVIAVSRIVLGGIVLGLASFTARRQSASRVHLLATYAMLAVGCLLTFYNRFYAAAALISVIGLAMYLIRIGRGRSGWIMLALVGPFVLPGVAMMRVLELGTLADSAVVQTWLWRIFYPHQVFMLLCIFTLLAITAWQLCNEPAPPDCPADALPRS
jgi:hypothetical protein